LEANYEKQEFDDFYLPFHLELSKFSMMLTTSLTQVQSYKEVKNTFKTEKEFNSKF